MTKLFGAAKLIGGAFGLLLLITIVVTVMGGGSKQSKNSFISQVNADQQQVSRIQTQLSQAEQQGLHADSSSNRTAIAAALTRVSTLASQAGSTTEALGGNIAALHAPSQWAAYQQQLVEGATKTANGEQQMSAALLDEARVVRSAVPGDRSAVAAAQADVARLTKAGQKVTAGAQEFEAAINLINAHR